MKPTLLSSALLLAVASVGHADPVFVEGMAIPGDTLDRSGGTAANNGRVGFFSDIFYDRVNNRWWGLSDRGPGGGFLSYDTRVQRFDIQINPVHGKISNFRVVETVIFRDLSGNPLNGISPNPTDVLGNSFDPEGFVVDPNSGHFYVSDEYGPSVYEFSREGFLLHKFATPVNLIPRNAGGTPNYASDAGNTAGKRTNRGFEGLAMSPQGDFIYAMLQSAMLDEGGGGGRCNRIVKFSTATHAAVAQYAYEMEGSNQGRGISALLALSDTEFLVLERNNQGIGVGATLGTPNKKVYRIDIEDAEDISGQTLPSENCGGGLVKDTTPFLDIAANTLGAIGNKVPEKWEGLAIGPQLKDGSYMMLAGTDNDYSVTQNGSNVQFDVYFRFSDTDPYASSIQCPLGEKTQCFWTTGLAPAVLPKNHTYKLLPGVLHSYKVPAADLGW